MKLIYTLLSSIILLISVSETTYSQLTVYSGRSKALVDPLIQEFEKETGITVRVRYGGTTQLAVALMEEGRRTPADLFWAQDAGALGAVHAEGLLAVLPETITGSLPAEFRNTDFTWVATSGRARVLAFGTRNIDPNNLPESVFDLTDPKWRGRVGWSPANASFQSFVTGMRALYGDDVTRKWLSDMRSNVAVAYNNNNSIIQALAAGEVHLGITNHYYLDRIKSTDPNYPVGQRFFKAGDAGNLVNVAGVGILNPSKRQKDAQRFIEFLLSEKAQKYFINEVFEYPVRQIDGFDDRAIRSVLDVTPELDLDILRDLEGTLRMLRETGLL